MMGHMSERRLDETSHGEGRDSSRLGRLGEEGWSSSNGGIRIRDSFTPMNVFVQAKTF